MVGGVTGDVVGDLTGDVVGGVTGNVIGDLTGDVVGDVTGTVSGSAGSILETGANAEVILTKVVELGVWDMDALAALFPAHGIADFTKIRAIKVVVRDDAGTTYLPLDSYQFTGGINDGGVDNYGGATVTLRRSDTGNFNNANYNDGVINRGYMTIWYAT